MGVKTSNECPRFGVPNPLNLDAQHSQGQNLASTVLCVPNLLDSSRAGVQRAFPTPTLLLPPHLKVQRSGRGPLSGEYTRQSRPDTSQSKLTRKTVKARHKTVKDDKQDSQGQTQDSQGWSAACFPHPSLAVAPPPEGIIVFKAHRVLYHSTLGLRVINKKRKVKARVCEGGRGVRW